MRRRATRRGRDGHGPHAARRWGRAAGALVALLLAGEARAERLRVVVLVAGEEHRELAARIKGQAADLDATVSTAEAALPPTLDGQVAVARAAGAAGDVVVWFDADAQGRVAYVARGDRVLVRRIAVAPGALSRSASSEAVALAVRTALRGLAASGEPDAPAADPAASPIRPWAELGGTGLADGTRAAGQYGAALRGGVARGRWYLGASVAYQPAARVDGAPASIQVDRQQAAAVLGADLLAPASAGRWSLALELGAGAARFSRETRATGAGLVATPAAASWSPVVSPALRVARRVASHASAALAVGADVVPRPPQFGIERSGDFEQFAAVWAIQPRVALSLLLDRR